MNTSQRSEFQQGVNRSTGSYELVFSPVILSLLGLWLDRTVGTTALFAVLFAILGFIGSAILIYFRYSAEMAEHEKGRPWAKPS